MKCPIGLSILNGYDKLYPRSLVWTLPRHFTVHTFIEPIKLYHVLKYASGWGLKHPIENISTLID